MGARYSIRKDGNGDYPWVTVLRMDGGYGLRAAYKTWADAREAATMSPGGYFVGYPIERVEPATWGESILQWLL